MEIDLTDPEIKEWQRENMRFTLAGWTLITEIGLDGEVRMYRERDGARIPNDPPQSQAPI